MPQIVKGGKYVFGWSRVGCEGRIVIPPEALKEYGFQNSNKLILIPGSRTSGGFGLGTLESIRSSPMGRVLENNPALGEFRISEGEVIEHKGKPYCWIKIRNEGISLPVCTLEKYGISVGDMLLVIRGSGLAIGFAVRGPIVEEARNHPELEVFSSK